MCVSKRIKEISTKWFGKDVWPTADGCMFLHSGRPLPERDAVTHRGEGVRILFNGVATEAWRQAGEVWKAVSSRIIMAKLRWTGCGSDHHDSKRTPLYVTVVCVCMHQLLLLLLEYNQSLGMIFKTLLMLSPSGDLLVLLGDFNARVGVLGPNEENRRGVVGDMA